MQDDQNEKKLKALLRGEFLPLFIGLRTELKSIAERLDKANAKELPEVFKTQITNLPEPIKELVVLNLPEIQKTEITNFPEPQSEVKVKGIDGYIGHLIKTFSAFFGEIKDLGREIKDGILKVEIQNQKEYPTSIKVSNLGDIKQPEPPTFPASIKISNYEPSEAIPVVLATKDRKHFYETLQQILTNTGVNLSGIISKLDTIISLMGGSTGNSKTIFGELSVAATTETTICSYTTPSGKKFDLGGIYAEGVEDGIFRLYKNSTKVWQGRNSWSNRNVQAEIDLSLAAADVVYLKVYNPRGWANNYSGTIYGNEV